MALVTAEAVCVSQAMLFQEEVPYLGTREGLHDGGRSVIIWGTTEYGWETNRKCC